MNEYEFDNLALGLQESLVVDIRQEDVEAFMELSGDVSTVHVDDAYARSRRFDQRLVHGVLVASYVSQLIGIRLPGKHGVLRSLNCEFRRPCYAPGRLTIVGTVDRLVQSMRLVGMTIEVRDKAGDLLVLAKAESVLKM